MVVLVASATGASGARADGLPVLGIDVGSSGVAAPGGSARYVAIPAPGGTMVERIRQSGGQVLEAVFLTGTFTIPAVAYDGSASGLSGDRRTLVLIEPRRSFPRATTSLLVLRAPSLAHRALVHLRGDFSFDAVSPDGSRLFLIQYLSPTDPTRYAVRSFDVAALRLAPNPIVDPREPAETMRGNPLSRATSADGRWAYTLYDGGGARPFVHALDTANATARCIDLDGLAPGIVSRLRLSMADDGRVVRVLDGGTPLLAMSTRTFAVSTPSDSRSRPAPWLEIAAGVLAIAALAFALLRRRRPARAPVPVD
jgi:hypothetical protein